MNVLYLDDEPDALKNFVRNVDRKEIRDGGVFHVEARLITDSAVWRDVLESLEREESYYDVIVTDMYMAENEECGLELLERFVASAPVVIVLTGHAPSIPRAVKVMRKGAWDYIPKKEPIADEEDAVLSGARRTPAPDAFDRVLQSIEKARSDRRNSLMPYRHTRDDKWVRECLASLADQYAGKFVAVLDKKVRCSADSLEALQAELRSQYPYALPTIVQVPPGI